MNLLKKINTMFAGNRQLPKQLAGFLIVFVVMFGALYTVPFPKKALAQLPFGGMNLNTFFCPCSGNFRITVGPPRGGIFMYNPYSTILYSFFMVTRPGAWLLGLYTAPSACVVPCHLGCCVIGVYPTMLMVGTSL